MVEGERELASGDGWLSDESSLYGDDEEERLTSSEEKLKLETYIKDQKSDLNHILHKKRIMPPPVLSNPRQDHPYSWQLNESVDDFLERVPPLTTCAESWIWAANPCPDGQDRSGPAKVDDLTSRGQDLLQQSLARRENIIQANSDKPRATLVRLLNKEAETLKQQIFDLAAETNIVSGKWMLFPALGVLNRDWRMVVKGTILNRLGPLAKVATDQGNSTERLICVYTRDFRDTDDVLRVLKELVTMGIVRSEKCIYYKSDAYTYLHLYSRNAPDYGLQASAFSSQSMLAAEKRSKAKATPQTQFTLEPAFCRSNQ